MRIVQLLAAVLAASLITACASGLKVQTDYDEAYNFAAATKFSVSPSQTLGSGALRGNDILKNRVVNAIENSMRARGYQIVPPSEADLHISFFVTTEDKTDIRTYNSGFSYNRCYRAGCGFYAPYGGAQEVDVRHYTKGTLFLDFIDPATNTLEWRGTTSKRLGDMPASMDERNEIVNTVINAVLSEYPPTMAE